MPQHSASFFKNNNQPTGTQLPKQLTYSGLSAGIVQGYCYEWRQYNVQQHCSVAAPTGTVFILFTRQKVRLTRQDDCSDVEVLLTRQDDCSDARLQRSPDSGPKLHVALKTENSANINSDIQTAFNAILRVLDDHKFECFKVVLQSKLDEFIASGQYGKIFTVYLGERTKAQTNQIAFDIEHALDNARRYPQLQPPEKRATDCVERVDQAVNGCRFVTYADVREEAGMGAIMSRFSRQQEGHLSSDMSSLGIASGAPQREESNVECKF